MAVSGCRCCSLERRAAALSMPAGRATDTPFCAPAADGAPTSAAAAAASWDRRAAGGCHRVGGRCGKTVAAGLTAADALLAGMSSVTRAASALSCPVRRLLGRTIFVFLLRVPPPCAAPGALPAYFTRSGVVGRENGSGEGGTGTAASDVGTPCGRMLACSGLAAGAIWRVPLGRLRRLDSAVRAETAWCAARVSSPGRARTFLLPADVRGSG